MMESKISNDKNEKLTLVDRLSVCGHIYRSHDRFYFDLICTLCQRSYTKFEDFVQHILLEHTPDNGSDDFSANEQSEIEEIFEESSQEEALQVEFEEELFMIDDESSQCQIEEDILYDEYNETLNSCGSISSACSTSDPVEQSNSELLIDTQDDYDPLLNESRLKLKQRSSKETIMADFVDLYHKLPFLWKKNLPGYRDKKIRSAALKILLKKFKEFKSTEVNILSVQEQIDALRKRFTYIQKKMLMAEQKAEEYATTWTLFDKLTFLYTDELPRNYDCTFCKKQIASWKKLFEHLEQNHADVNEEPMPTVNKTFSKEFIQLYKKNECLWNSKSSDYRKKDKVLKAYDSLITKLREIEPDANKRSASKKIAYYRTMFRQQYKRIEVMRRMNKTFDYENFMFYKELKFLMNDAMEIDEIRSEVEEEDSEVIPERLCTCNICGKTFSSNSSLSTHLESHNERTVKCESCNRCFKSQRRLLHHMMLHTGEFPYHCETCGKGFQRISGLRDHKYVHLPPEMRPFECEYCGVKISNRQNFTIHLRRHTKEYRYHCEVCNKGVVTKSELHLHMRTHSDDKPFVCDICGASYKRRNVFSNHMKKHTGIRDQKCTVCDKAFFLYRDLKEHLQTHSATKDFACDECGAAFHTKTNLKQHQLLHLPDKKFICKICNSAFAQRAGLHSHMKSH